MAYAKRSRKTSSAKSRGGYRRYGATKRTSSARRSRSVRPRAAGVMRLEIVHKSEPSTAPGAPVPGLEPTVADRRVRKARA